MRFRSYDIGGYTYTEEMDDGGCGCLLLVLAIVLGIIIAIVQGVGSMFGVDPIGMLFENLEGITGPCGTCTPQ